MTPGTRKICAVLRLKEGDQGNLAHRFPDIPVARLIGSHGEDLVQFALISVAYITARAGERRRRCRRRPASSTSRAIRPAPAQVWDVPHWICDARPTVPAPMKIFAGPSPVRARTYVENIAGQVRPLFASACRLRF